MEPEQDTDWGSGLQPTDAKIIDYLKKKRLDPAFVHNAIEEIKVYDYDPWDLPWKSKIKAEEQVWYFFNKPYKYAKSNRQHRRTRAGRWTISGKGSNIKAKDRKEVIGSKSILLFYLHDPNPKALKTDPKELKTEWIMHEFYVKNHPEFKEDFVVCRVERKRDCKHAISTYHEGRSSHYSASSSGIHDTENIFPEPIQPAAPSQEMVSDRNHVAEISRTQQLSSDHLISYPGNHVAEVAFPESHLLLCRDHFVENTSPDTVLLPNHFAGNASPEDPLSPNYSLISYSENHTIENTSPQPQPPNDNFIFQKTVFLNSQLLSGGHFISYTENLVSETPSPESHLLPNQDIISHPGNHVTDITYSKSQLPPNQIVENSSLESQKIPNHNMISCSQNQIADKIPSEFQLLLNNNLISYPGNHIVENTFTYSQLLPNPDLESLANQHLASQIVPNPDLESQANQHLASQILPNPDLESQANQHLVSNILPNPYLEWQTLPNQNFVVVANQHLVSQLQQNSDLESQLQPNQHLFSYSINDALERGFPTEHPAPAESNAGNSYNGLEYESFYALLSPIYPENGSSYSSISSNDCNMLNSKFGIEQVAGLVSSQKAFQEDYSCEGTGETLTPDFNSSKQGGGVYVDDSSNMETEIMDAWVEKLCENIT